MSEEKTPQEKYRANIKFALENMKDKPDECLEYIMQGADVYAKNHTMFQEQAFIFATLKVIEKWRKPVMDYLAENLKSDWELFKKTRES